MPLRATPEHAESDSYRSAVADLVATFARSATPDTITVVGNAPMPPDPHRAAVIDGSDLVVRMTSFALDAPDAAPALGRRCDVVVLHRGVMASPFLFADYTDRLYLLVEPGRLHWEREEIPAGWPGDLGFVAVSNYAFTVPLLHMLRLGRAEAVWPTTGTLAAYVCTELFPGATTRLTGLSLVDNPDQTEFEHAWGEKVAVTAEHRLYREAMLLRRWHDEGRIELLP